MSGKGRGPAIGIDLSGEEDTNFPKAGRLVEVTPGHEGSEDCSSPRVSVEPQENTSEVSGTDRQAVLMSGDMNPVNTVSDAEKQKEDEEAKQMLVDMIVNDTIRKTGFMEKLRQTKVDAGQIAWDEKRKLEKEHSKKKREALQKKREAR